MEITIFVILVAFAAFFLWLAFLYFGREKYPTSTFLAGAAAFLILCGLPWFQGFVKSWLSSSINAKFKSLGDQVNGVQMTTAEMQTQLDNHQKTIENHQKELNGIQSEIRLTQTNITNEQITNGLQLQQIVKLNNEVASAQTNLNTQQEKIEDVEFLVNNLFSKTETETLAGNDTNHVMLLKDFGTTKTIGFFLKNSAFPNSIHGMVDGGGLLGQMVMKPIAPSHRNFFMANFDGIDIPTSQFVFQYVKDSRETNVARIQTLTSNVLILDDWWGLDLKR